jgi:uncharacterized protein
MFKRVNNSTVLVTSYAGEYLFLTTNEFSDLVNGKVPKNSATFFKLVQKNILPEQDPNISLNLLATKYRSRKAFLKDFTSLHMIVLTKGCNCNCRYCQVSSLPFDGSEIHMTKRTAKKVVDMIFATPSKNIKIEFQGGEPLLNWSVLKYIVNYVLILNKLYKKNLEFVVCSNLVWINDNIIKFFKARDVKISTSLDGPKDVHDKNRPCRNGQSSYDLLMENLEKVNKALGKDFCSPLVTLTKESLPRLKEIIDLYKELGYNGIFLRPVNPYGNAKENWGSLACDIDDYIKQYKTALEYIIELNLKGEFFIEYYTMLLLSRILTPFSTGFVDLQSPSGAGIGGAIYDYNGDVFPSDEARMLARNADYFFKLGNVYNNTYEEVFQGEKLKRINKSSFLEGLPGCSTCVYQPYCGSDPIRYYAESGNIRGFRSSSDFCRKNKELFDYLFEILGSNNQEIMDVFWSWITCRSLSEVIL